MDTHFDVLVLGTGLTQSIAAAALAKAGLSVAHVDTNAYYGGDQASLTHDELLEWARSHPATTSPSPAASLPHARAYSLSLAPALIPAAGPLITALIASGVSRYGQFKLLDAVYIHRRGALARVPATKEDVFTARDVSLRDKRTLMRFLQFAAADFEARPELVGKHDTPLGDFMRDVFSLGEDAREAILYALAYCSSAADPTLPALQRLRSYLRSSGRYGNSPFLVGHYGGLGELAQGFCRTCAVKGGTYILGRPIISLRLPGESPTAPAAIELQDVPDVLTADVVIAPPEYLPPPTPDAASPQPSSDAPSYACAIAITSSPIAVPAPPAPPDTAAPADAPDTAVVVFAPGSLAGGTAPHAVRVLQMGEATLSCPSGKYILYAWTPSHPNAEITPETLLTPYLTALTPPSHIAFSCFYTRADPPTSAPNPDPNSRPNSSPNPTPRTLPVPPLPSSWPAIGDHAAQDAEALFWAAVNALGRGAEIDAVWPPLEEEGGGDEEEGLGEEW